MQLDVILESNVPDVDEFVTKLAKWFMAIPLKSSKAVCASLSNKDIRLLSKEYTVYKAKPVNIMPLVKVRSPIGENLSQIGVTEAHEKAKGKNSRIEIIDTGINYEHPDLSGRFTSVKGYDFIADIDDCMDYNGHGTHVAGIVGGEYTGVSPKATLYGLRVLDEAGSGTEVGVIRALEWAVENRVDVCNLSLGSTRKSQYEERAVQYAINHGVSVCAAAGNSGIREYTYPASYENVISVAAVDNNNKRARFSTRNDLLTISAPGIQIESTSWLGDYVRMSGTSMSTPHVAGTLALFNSIDQSLTPQRAKEVASATAQQLGKPDDYGAGLVRADRVVAHFRPWWHVINNVLEEILRNS